MYEPKDIIAILANNVRKTMSPFGIPKSMVNGWWKEESLPRNGETLLVTGLMYQLVPFIETATTWLARYEDAKWAEYLPYSRFVPPRLSGLGLAMITPAEAKRKAAGHLKNIVKAMRASGRRFGYQPELDEYSGILLYDLGDQEGFVRHAKRVAARLKGAGVTSIVTVDPHTTYALKVLYPKYADASFEVRAYFEDLNLSGAHAGETLSIHDPCFYGRYLELSGASRKALGNLGYACADARRSGLFTSCCGGPAESISPKLASRIGAKRVEALGGSGERIVTMCPICLHNLEKAGADVTDLSTVLAGGLKTA